MIQNDQILRLMFDPFHSCVQNVSLTLYIISFYPFSKIWVPSLQLY